MADRLGMESGPAVFSSKESKDILMCYNRQCGGAMNADTTRDADVRQHEIFKGMPGEEKVRMAMVFSDFVRDLALEGLKSRYPSASEAERRILFIREVHGVEIVDLSGEERHE
jgi:hypothetical protein